MTTTSKPRATLTMPSDTELVITREFNAPRALLFEALSKPEHVKRWYGLRQLTMPVCEMDFRPGGKWRYVLHDTAHGMDHAFSGEYKEIDAPARIVSSERYEAIPEQRLSRDRHPRRGRRQDDADVASRVSVEGPSRRARDVGNGSRACRRPTSGSTSCSPRSARTRDTR